MITGLTKEEIKYFSQFVSKPTEPLRDSIEDIFGQEVNKIVDDGGRYSGLYSRLYSLALDPGLKRRHEFLGKHASPVAMLNRQAFLYELRKKSGFKEQTENERRVFSTEKPITILNLDIAGLRFADQGHFADYNLNIFAAKLNEIIKNYIKNNLRNSNREILVGRYGGDEFSIGLIGKFSNEEIDKIKKLLTRELESTKCIADSQGQEGRFSLKNHQVEQIDIPEDEYERTIFYSFLQKGLVLNNDQIKKEKKYLSDYQGILDERRLASYLKLASVDSEDVGLDFEVKINNIINKHPELKVPFYYAELQDNQKVDREKTRQKQVLEFVENYMIDTLLDEIVMSRFDIIDHFERGEFSKVSSFEIKLKEINDDLGYVYGDEVITTFWKNSLKPKIKKFIENGVIKVGRIGGTIVIGVKKGEENNDELKKAIGELSKTTSVNIKYRDQDINHIVGFAEVNVKDCQGNREKSQEKLSEIFNNLSRDWLEKLLRYILNLENLEEFKNMILDVEGIYNEENTGNLDLLLKARYFGSKRFEERISLARKILSELKINNKFQEKIEEIKRLFDEIEAQLKNKYHQQEN